MTAIGTLLPAPLRCGDPDRDPYHRHLPATYNPWLDATACICGARWWNGLTPTVWKSVSRHRIRDDAPAITYAIGTGAAVGLTDRYETTGWDTYELRTT